MSNVKTPKGFARILKRGFEAVYNDPEKELAHFSQSLLEMAMILQADWTETDSRRARDDSDFLRELADLLED